MPLRSYAFAVALCVAHDDRLDAASDIGTIEVR
jgi:hypothetical protein